MEPTDPKHFYAHSHPGFPDDPSKWEPLFTRFGDGVGECRGRECKLCEALEPYHGHMNKVARWTAKFAEEMFAEGSEEAEAAREWGWLAGLWHDLGKFAPEWQAYLRSKADTHTADVSGNVDHSTAGAQHATKVHSILGQILAYAIAGHHSGLLDGKSNGACQATRLKKSDLPDLQAVPEQVTAQSIPKFPAFLQRDPFSISFFTRMNFSCLVDADFLATEAFMSPDQSELRNHAPALVLREISRLVDERIDSFGIPSQTDIVNHQRRKVVENCRSAANQCAGLFSLTVPTGGGKTLSSLSFALRHALANGQRRVIYVVPFTSIIEQNAGVFREILAPLQSEGFTPLIEHHSSLSPEKDSTQSRLAAENWDAPIIITTAVQFYESLFAAKTSRCRKLHRIANSVVILDEAQSLPVDFLKPCLRVIQELTNHYQTTVVLCTATQPAVQYDEAEFAIGLKNCREIITNTRSLFDALKRVEVKPLGDVTDEALVDRLTSHSQALCIVNRRKHAQKLFQMLGQNTGNFHLSALMCPEHRSLILTEVRQRLRDRQPTRVISTQLIEAGVDVDFPFVYRALAGLDSIAQAAGRCNRNGNLSAPGLTYVFRPEDQRAETYFRETAQVAFQLIDLYPDLLSEEAIRHYFYLYYYQQSRRWDKKGILDPESFYLDGGDKTFPFHFQFRSVAENFRLIDDWQVPVIIPFDQKSRGLLEELRNPSIPLYRNLMRVLQRYTVQIPPRLRDDNIQSFEVLREGQFHVLISTEINYSNDFGLVFDDGHASIQTLICEQ